MPSKLDKISENFQKSSPYPRNKFAEMTKYLARQLGNHEIQDQPQQQIINNKTQIHEAGDLSQLDEMEIN